MWKPRSFAWVLAIVVAGIILSIALDTLSQPQADVTIYVTRTGSKYHQAGCRYLSQSAIAISLSKAKAQGYTPCSVCNPPK
jgi:micrococcal nuclease